MAGRRDDWGSLLDRLSHCITPKEEAGVRHASVDRGDPSHLKDLHNHVAGLLVKYSITTWHHLQTSFPGTVLMHVLIEGGGGEGDQEVEGGGGREGDVGC